MRKENQLMPTVILVSGSHDKETSMNNKERI
jgi:hypothetical protein